MDQLILKVKLRAAHNAIEDLRNYLYQFDNELPTEQGVKAMNAQQLIEIARFVYTRMAMKDKDR